jgi:hypothetical protein
MKVWLYPCFGKIVSLKWEIGRYQARLIPLQAVEMFPIRDHPEDESEQDQYQKGGQQTATSTTQSRERCKMLDDPHSG